MFEKLEPTDFKLLRRSFLETIDACNSRCMNLSSKWLSEQLMGMDLETRFPDSFFDELYQPKSFRISSKEESFILFAQTLIRNGEYLRCSDLLTKTRFVTSPSGSKDLLIQQPEIEFRSPVTHFLANYSLYLAGEKLKDQQSIESVIIDSPTTSSSIVEKAIQNQISKCETGHSRNPYLPQMYQSLSALYLRRKEGDSRKGENINGREGVMDAFLLYLFGVVVRDLAKDEGQGNEGEWGEEEEEDRFSPSVSFSFAQHLFLSSLCLCPYNWSCWLELSSLLSARPSSAPSNPFAFSFPSASPSSSALSDLLAPLLRPSPPPHSPLPSLPSLLNMHDRLEGREEDKLGLAIMHHWFSAHLLLLTHQPDLSSPSLDLLAPLFPSSPALSLLRATYWFEKRKYNESHDEFSALRSAHPLRPEGSDTLSNVLYTLQMKPSLSSLAQHLSRLCPFSPEACLAAGNLYSLRGQPERALTYFQRALRLEPSLSSAWTLSGHECCELRNSEGAVQCYRRALQIDIRDFRAWNGLGTLYEMRDLPLLAAHYYSQALVFCPSDPRLWVSLGLCIRKGEGQGHGRDLARQCLERAVEEDEEDVTATQELVGMYVEEEEWGEGRGRGREGRVEQLLIRLMEGRGLVQGGRVEPLASSRLTSDLMKPVLVLARLLLRPSSSPSRPPQLALSSDLCSLLVGGLGSESGEAREILTQIQHMRMSTSNQHPLPSYPSAPQPPPFHPSPISSPTSPSYTFHPPPQSLSPPSPSPSSPSFVYSPQPNQNEPEGRANPYPHPHPLLDLSPLPSIPSPSDLSRASSLPHSGYLFSPSGLLTPLNRHRTIQRNRDRDGGGSVLGDTPSPSFYSPPPMSLTPSPSPMPFTGHHSTLSPLVSPLPSDPLPNRRRRNN